MIAFPTESLQSKISEIINDIQDQIKQFTKAIISFDMGEQALQEQKNEWNLTKLKSPLPIDTATRIVTKTTEMKFIDQLIIPNTQTISNLLYIPLKNSLEDGVQSKTSIFTTAAASGVGKTFLAYQVGKIIPTIIIRIGIGKGCLSSPWKKLKDTIYGIGNASPLSLETASKSFLVVKLLISCYLYVSNYVLTLCNEQNLSGKEEVLLRFHRNGVTEEIISNLFSKLSVLLLDSKQDCDAFISTNCKNTGSFLLCFDEMQSLLEESVIQTGTYQDQNSGRCSQMSAENNRGIFNMLTWFLSDLARKTNIRSFYTGTNFSITKIIDNSGAVERFNFHRVDLSTTNFLSVKDMIEILHHYWAFNIVGDREIEELLGEFIGRPLYFVDFVFKKIRFQKFVQRGYDDTLFLTDFKEYLKTAAINLQNNVEERVKGLLNRSRLLSSELYETNSISSLYPEVIRTVMCGDGILRLSEDEFAEVIRTVLIPATSKDEAIDLAKVEPITFRCLRKALIEKLQSPKDFQKIFAVLSASLRGAPSTTKEEAICYYLALRVAATKNGEMSLSDLLSPLFPPNYKEDEKLHHVYVRCNSVHSVYNAKTVPNQSRSNQTFSAFVRDDSTYRDDLIIWGYDREMGVDITFLGKIDERFVLVVCQSKGDITDATLTLSPGLQFLNNTQRSAILTGTTDNMSIRQRANLITKKSVKRVEYEKFLALHTLFANNWIRVSLAATTINTSAFQQMLADEKDIPDELLRVYTSSPLIPLSFNSLPTEFQSFFVPNTTESKESTMPKKPRAFYPISVDYANKCLRNFQIEGDVHNKIIPNRYRLLCWAVVATAAVVVVQGQICE